MAGTLAVGATLTGVRGEDHHSDGLLLARCDGADADGEHHHSDGQLHTGGDRAIATLAERQHGVVSREQLRALGVQRGAVERRLDAGRLHPVHRGVYAVGHRRLTLRGRLWGAVLGCGGLDAAALSHRSAAAVLDLMPTPAGPVDVVTLRSSESRPGIRVHRTATLDPLVDVVRLADGLPVTSVARTLTDLAGVLTPHTLERVCHRAQVLRVLDATAVRVSGIRGARALRAALATLEAHDPQITRRELEERFPALVTRAGLSRPLVNARVAGHEVDFLWPDHRLVVETDGAATHLTATAFEHDRRRDAELLLAGYRVVRFTWRQVTERADTVARTLSALLATVPAP